MTKAQRKQAKLGNALRAFHHGGGWVQGKNGKIVTLGEKAAKTRVERHLWRLRHTLDHKVVAEIKTYINA